MLKVKHPEPTSGPSINRYVRHTSTDDVHVCHVWFVDRVTGQEILSYEVNDAAPVKPNEVELFIKLGLDLGERVLTDRCKIKPRGSREMLDIAVRDVLRLEREEDMQRGLELLVELDLWSYFDLDAGDFDPSKLEEFETHQLIPAMTKKDFTFIACFTDISGRRGVRALRSDKSYVFFYA